jgi:hypothetical protein
MKCKWVEVYHNEFQQSLLNGLCDTGRGPFNGIMYNKPAYESIWLKIGISRHVVAEVSHVEFKQNQRKDSWNIKKNPSMAICKLGFIMNRCDC